jgi:drug/metabolite transporter (DMT)-like permease
MNRSTQADLVFIGIVCLWGTSFALVKGALALVTPTLFVILRFLIAGAIWGALFGRALKEAKPGTLWRGMLLGAVLGTGFVLQTAGLRLTTASMSGFVTGLAVVVVPFWVVAIQRKIPRLTSLAGVVVCAIGLLLLSSPSGGGLNQGDLLTVGCASLFALYIVLVEVFTSGFDPRALTLAQAFGILLVAGIALPFVESPSVTWSWPLIWRGLALGTMAAFTLALQLHWQRYITATRAGIIFTLEQPLAALFAFLLLGEVLTGTGYLGGGLIFLGMVVSEGGARLIPGRPRTSSEGMQRNNS